jgi:hypothetical protein
MGGFADASIKTYYYYQGGLTTIHAQGM